MSTSSEIKQRASALAEKTDVNSITPKEVGGIMFDLASHSENVLRNSGTLGIRKVYKSVAAMEADATEPVDLWGEPIKKGNLVVIYDGTDNGVDNNKIYAFMKPGWELATKLDAAYATKSEMDAKLSELASDVKTKASIESLNSEVSRAKSEEQRLDGIKLNKSDIEGYKNEINNKVASQDNVIDDFKEAVTNQINEYKPIEINGNVTNAADEEDLTSENGLLKLKDRSALNGMGYVILRKNKSFAEQVTLQNTIYEIRYDFDLDGEEVAIPEGCVLYFQGGSLNNGYLVGNNTSIYSNSVAFYKVEIKGKFKNSVIKSLWFDFKDNYENDTPIFLNLISLAKIIHFESKAYSFELSENIMEIGCRLVGSYDGDANATAFRLRDKDEKCKFLLGLSYKCGISNISIQCYNTNRVLDIIRADNYFGCSGGSASDRELTIKNVLFNYAPYYNLTEEERSILYFTALHFRHTDNNIYDINNPRISKTTVDGFSYRGGDFDNIHIKLFHIGIKFTTGYNKQFMWVNGIYLNKLVIWAGKGICFEHDAQCSTERPVERLHVTEYMFQSIKDDNPDNFIGQYNYGSGFWGEIRTLLVKDYDYWDTVIRGAVNGDIYQSNISGVINTNEIDSGGWSILDKNKSLRVFIWNDSHGYNTENDLQIRGTSAIDLKTNLSGNNYMEYPDYYGYVRKFNVAPKDVKSYPDDASYGVYESSNNDYTRRVFNNNPWQPYLTEKISDTKASYEFAVPFTIIEQGVTLLKGIPNIRHDSDLSNKVGIVNYVLDGGNIRYGLLKDNKVESLDGTVLVDYNYPSLEDLLNKISFSWKDNGKIVVVDNQPCIVDRDKFNSKRIIRRITTKPLNAYRRGRAFTFPTDLISSTDNTNSDIGFAYFNIDTNQFVFWDGTKFVSVDGYDASYKRKGSTNDRPSPTNIDSGFLYFDTTINKPVWWTGSKWVDANGTEV